VTVRAIRELVPGGEETEHRRDADRRQRCGDDDANQRAQNRQAFDTRRFDQFLPAEKYPKHRPLYPSRPRPTLLLQARPTAARFSQGDDFDPIHCPQQSLGIDRVSQMARQSETRSSPDAYPVHHVPVDDLHHLANSENRSASCSPNRVKPSTASSTLPLSTSSSAIVAH
jgi:hypothetical protein